MFLAPHFPPIQPSLGSELNRVGPLCSVSALECDDRQHRQTGCGLARPGCSCHSVVNHPWCDISTIHFLSTIVGKCAMIPHVPLGFVFQVHPMCLPSQSLYSDSFQRGPWTACNTIGKRNIATEPHQGPMSRTRGRTAVEVCSHGPHKIDLGLQARQQQYADAIGLLLLQPLCPWRCKIV